MENKSLVSLVSKVSQIEKHLLEGDGVLPPELEQEFDLLSNLTKEKVDAYYFVMQALDARALYLKDMENQFKHARQTLENHKEQMRGNIRHSMCALTTDLLEGYDFRFKLSNGKSKLIIDEEVLPAEYWKRECVDVPDKELLERELLLGKEVLGAHFEASTTLRSYINPGTKAKPVKEIK